MKLHVMLTAVGAAVLCTDALAQTPAPAPQASAAPASMSSAFSSLDANRDGRISEAEAQAVPVVARNFKDADANHDGAITPEEFSSAFKLNAPAESPSSSGPVPPASPR
jgi:EF hand domain-containing protein